MEIEPVQITLNRAIGLTRPRGRSWSSWCWQFARSKPLGAVATIIIAVLILSAVFAPWVAPHDPLQQFPELRLAPANQTFLLGGDEVGRDILSRIIWGGRISLWVGIVSVGLGVVSGAILGLISGYWGGNVDQVIQRIMDSIMVFPAILLAMVIISVLRPGITNVMIAIAVVLTPDTSRLVRSSVLSVRENQYIEAARALGCRDLRILRRHILPNVAAPIIVIATIYLGSAIIIEASLSFLGLGTPPPTPSWGAMLSGPSRTFLMRAPWLALWPGLAISLVVLSFNLLGDSLRDIWDPRLRRGR